MYKLLAVGIVLKMESYNLGSLSEIFMLKVNMNISQNNTKLSDGSYHVNDSLFDFYLGKKLQLYERITAY